MKSSNFCGKRNGSTASRTTGRDGCGPSKPRRRRGTPSLPSHFSLLTFPLSLPVARQVTRLVAGKVGPALAGQQAAVDPEVPHEHLDPLFEELAEDPAFAHVLLVGKRHPVRKGPGVTLPRHGPQLV